MSENDTNPTVSCPKCGGICLAHAIACKHCGHLLKDLGEGNPNQTLVVPRTLPEMPDDDLSDTGKLSDTGNLNLVGTSRFNSGSVLYLSVERVNSPITRYVRDEPMIVGRSETSELGNDAVNLHPYNARSRGVSRRHAQIHRENGTLYIQDLGSSNGTYVNGQKLSPNDPHPLHDGDEIILGRMMLWVNF